MLLFQVINRPGQANDKVNVHFKGMLAELGAEYGTATA